jgi:Amt family ammonium transporter
VTAILLIPLAFAGLALMNAGLARSRSAAHSLMSTLTVVAAAALAYAACGFAWQGFPGHAAYAFTVAGKQWNWIGAERFFLSGLDFDGADPSASRAGFAACFGMFGAGLAAIIPLGAGEERWRLGSAAVSAALLAGWTFPIFAHWVWGGGWLAQLGENYGLGRGFVDTGGSGTIQVLGGLTALSVSWILGPRRGKYNPQGMPSAMPGHNAVFVLFGALLALLGWFGLNSAGAILFYGAAPGRVPLIAINTTLAAASALLAAALVTRTRFGKPDAWLSANGWTGGLAASSASAAFLAPAEAIIVGLVAGVLVTFSVEWLELHLAVDDPGGAISVHAVAGLWSLLAAGFLGRFPGAAGGGGQWLAQLAGIATLLGFVFPLTYGINWALNRLSPYRVTPDGERQGMDLHELGANAYPELASHLEDFTQR